MGSRAEGIKPWGLDERGLRVRGLVEGGGVQKMPRQHVDGVVVCEGG